MEIIKTNCECCGSQTSIEEVYECEICGRVIAECCQAPYNSLSQIDYNCCIDCYDNRD